MLIALMAIFTLAGTAYLLYQIHSLNKDSDDVSEAEMKRKVDLDNLYFNLFTVGIVLLILCIGFIC